MGLSTPASGRLEPATHGQLSHDCEMLSICSLYQRVRAKLGALTLSTPAQSLAVLDHSRHW